MKSVIFEDIELAGFGSIIEPLRFQLDRPGISVIRGANGSGKSTVFNGIFWVLFGVTAKEVLSKDIPTLPEFRGKGWKGTYGKINFTIDGDKYTVTRTIKSKYDLEYVGATDLSIFSHRKGFNLADESRTSQSQERLDRLLGVDTSLFINSVFFAQKVDRLMDGRESDRRDIFEKILSGIMSDLDGIKARLSTKAGEVSTARSDLVVQKNRLEGSLDMLNQQVSRLQGLESQREELLSKKLTALDVKREAIQEEEKTIHKDYERALNQLDEYEESQKMLKEKILTIDKKYNIDELESKYLQTKSRESSLTTELRLLRNRNDIKDPELGSGEICPSCGSEVTEATVARLKAEIAHRRKERTKQVRKLESDLRKIQERLEKFKGLSKVKAVKQEYGQKLKVVEDKLRDLKWTIESASRRKTQCAKDLKALDDREREIRDESKSRKDELAEALDNQEQSGIKLKEIAQKVEDKDMLLRHYDWWGRVGFGSKGLKSYLFEGLLEEFNTQLSKYSAILGIGSVLRVDDTKKSRPFVLDCYDGEVVKSYASLSGGEQQRVNIGLLFALYETISAKTVSFNILLLDEVFEGLDAEGTTMVFDVLQQYRNKSIYVITHMEELSSNYLHFIECKKRGNNTTLTV